MHDPEFNTESADTKARKNPRRQQPELDAGGWIPVHRLFFNHQN